MIATAVFTAKVVLELDKAEAHWLKHLVASSDTVNETDVVNRSRIEKLIYVLSDALRGFK